MTKRNNKIRFTALFALTAFIGTSAMAAPVLFGPSYYLLDADIPAGFYQGGAPAFLDNFEDGPGIGGGLTASVIQSMVMTVLLMDQA